MADNYLEKRYEEVFGNGGSGKKKTVPAKTVHSLDTLLCRNRSHRGYDQSVVVTKDQLREIVKVNTMIASSVNQQALRFHLVTRDTGGDRLMSLIHFGRALPELNLPFPGTAPQAFIIICATKEINRSLDIDLGISLQSMALKAVDMGLNALMVRNFKAEDLIREFNLELFPVAVLAVGKGNEKIFLMPIGQEEDHNYYRKDGIHYVPKVRLDDLIIGE